MSSERTAEALTNPPGHLWRDKWIALSGPLYSYPRCPFPGRSALLSLFPSATSHATCLRVPSGIAYGRLRALPTGASPGADPRADQSNTGWTLNRFNGFEEGILRIPEPSRKVRGAQGIESYGLRCPIEGADGPASVPEISPGPEFEERFYVLTQFAKIAMGKSIIEFHIFRSEQTVRKSAPLRL